MSNAVQAQWSLDQSSHQIINVARGVLQAATTDNIQPLALLASEKLGSITPICSNTLSKIEATVIPAPQTAFVSFIKATIGYAANDSVSYLGRNLAGLQFIAIATMLVTALDLYEGAKALQAMINDSASDKTLVPTTTQLKALLSTLQPRCAQTRFADDFVGWKTLLCKELCPRNTRKRQLEDFVKIPEPEFIIKLVSELRNIHPQGDKSGIVVEVSDIDLASWIITYTKWCTGTPPRASFKNGNFILVANESQVELIIDISNIDDLRSRRRPEARFSTWSKINKLSTLIEEPFKSWYIKPFMVSIESYGHSKYPRIEGSVYAEAFEKAVAFKLSRSIKSLNSEEAYAEYSQAMPQGLRYRRPHPYSDTRAIWRVYDLLLGKVRGTNPDERDSRIDIALATDTETHLAPLRDQCTCNRSHSPNSLNQHDLETCAIFKYLEPKFWNFVRSCVFDIMALALYDSPNSLLIKLDNPSQMPGLRDLFEKLGLPQLSFWSELLEHALNMVGHHYNKFENSFNLKQWLITSFYGQAVWLKIFETREISKDGYLELSWNPGMVCHEGEVYNLVINDARQIWGGGIEGDLRSFPIKNAFEPTNFLHDHSLEWLVTAHEHKLEARLGLKKVHEIQHHTCGPPYNVLGALPHSHVLLECAHDSKSKLSAPDPSTIITAHIIDKKGMPRDESLIQVVAVDGSGDMRFHALSRINSKWGFESKAECDKIALRDSALWEYASTLTQKAQHLLERLSGDAFWALNTMFTYLDVTRMAMLRCNTSKGFTSSVHIRVHYYYYV